MPKAWEKAVLETWDKGIRIPTQYDKVGDPNSGDVSAPIKQIGSRDATRRSSMQFR